MQISHTLVAHSDGGVGGHCWRYPLFLRSSNLLAVSVSHLFASEWRYACHCLRVWGMQSLCAAVFVLCHDEYATGRRAAIFQADAAGEGL